MKILFLGTPDFVCPILERLHQEFNVIAVVTQPDKPVGRKQVMTPPPVKLKAEELRIPVLQPNTVSEILDPRSPNFLNNPNNLDFLVTASYGQYLPTKVLELPKTDALNIHPSLLPLYRGATPIQSALLNGDIKTGVSIIRMVKEMDAGPVFARRAFEIDPEIKFPELINQAFEIGAEMITEVINSYTSISPIEQNESEATHCSKISKEDGRVDFEKETAEQIHNKLRAFTPWPGVYTHFKGQKLSLLDFSSNLSPHSNPAGIVINENNNEVQITCKNGSITLYSLQLAGKKPTDIKSFINGHPDFIGAKLGI